MVQIRNKESCEADVERIKAKLATEVDSFYILSTGRAGTTFLARNLEERLGANINLHQTRQSRALSIASNIDLAFNIDFSRAIHSSERPVSTVDPQVSMFLARWLRSERPNHVKVVQLVRDPRDFVSSMMNWKNRRFQSRLSHHLVPFWSPSPMFHGVDITSYLSMSKFEQFAWTWNFKNSIFESIESLGIPFTRFRTEDLVSDSEEMERLIRFLELKEVTRQDAEGQIMNASEKKYFPSWKSWDERHAKIVKVHCGERMQGYGYGNEPEWLQL